MSESSITTKMVPVHLSKKNEEFTIIAAGDFHVGANAFNERAFKVFIKQIKKESIHRQVFILFMGDLFDSISPADRRFNAGERNTNMHKSQEKFKELIAPILNNPRITFVGSLIGNHELMYSRGDTDPIALIHQTTGIDHLGIKSYIYFDLKYKKKKIATLRTVAFHGAKNSATDYGRLKIIKDFLKENNLTHDEFLRMNDIVFYGHTHDCRVEKSPHLLVKPRSKEQGYRNQYGCLTGSFYDTANFTSKSYASNRGFEPLMVGYIKARVGFTLGINPEAITGNGLNPNVQELKWTDM